MKVSACIFTDKMIA